MKQISYLMLAMIVAFQPVAGAGPRESLISVGQRLSVLAAETDVRDVTAYLDEIDPDQARANLAALPPAQRRLLLAQVNRLTAAAGGRAVTLGEISVASQAGVRTAGAGLAVSVGLLALACYVIGLEIGCRLKASDRCVTRDDHCVAERLRQCRANIGFGSTPSAPAPRKLPDSVM